MHEICGSCREHIAQERALYGGAHRFEPLLLVGEAAVERRQLRLCDRVTAEPRPAATPFALLGNRKTGEPGHAREMPIDPDGAGIRVAP